MGYRDIYIIISLGEWICYIHILFRVYLGGMYKIFEPVVDSVVVQSAGRLVDGLY